jgi:Zinc finger, C3HC4 type (RING finger)
MVLDRITSASYVMLPLVLRCIQTTTFLIDAARNVFTMQKSTVCCAKHCKKCDDSSCDKTNDYVQSTQGNHGTIAADCCPRSITASKRSCETTTAPCMVSKTSSKLLWKQVTDLFMVFNCLKYILYITQKLCSILVMTIWQFRVITMLCVYIQTHFAAITILICVLLCSSGVRNKLRQLRQQLPDVIFAVLPGENMRETGVTHAVPYVPQSIYNAGALLCIASLYSGDWSQLDDSQSVQYSFTTHLFIMNFIFGIILKVPTAQQWTIDNMLVNMCATGMLYMIVYLAQKGVTLTDCPSDEQQQQQYNMFMTICYYLLRPPAWCMLKIWYMLSTLTRLVIGAEVTCIVVIVLRKCCCLIVRQRAHVIHIADDALHVVIQEGIALVLRRLSRTKYAYTRDIMTKCTRCHESVATAVSTPCGHTFFCWSCAEQYRDEHGDICNSCQENSTLVKLQQQQMCAICLEHVSGHDLFHIQQCGHQVYIIVCTKQLKLSYRHVQLQFIIEL